MCGRYTLSSTPEDLAIQFAISDPVPPLTPRYNVAPSQLVAVVGLKPDGVKRGIARLQWGLVPYWTNDPKSGPRPINARAETLLSKPTFRESFLEKRCLIPVTGFYEWRTEKRKKLPHHFRRRDGGVLAFAGLWDCWRGEDGKSLVTCCIVTVEANDLIRPFHDRMPAILTPDDYTAWLAHGTPAKQLQTLLRSYPAEEMEVAEVNPVVNSPKHDGPECLLPAA